MNKPISMETIRHITLTELLTAVAQDIETVRADFEDLTDIVFDRDLTDSPPDLSTEQLRDTFFTADYVFGFLEHADKEDFDCSSLQDLIINLRAESDFIIQWK